MSYNYPGQAQYSQGQPGQPQYSGQGQPHQNPPYHHHQPPQQYGQPPQGYPPQGGHSPAPPPSSGAGYPAQGHSSPGVPQGYYPSQSQPPVPRTGSSSSSSSAAAAATSAANDHGAFRGGSYAITHRDTNTVLTVDLAPGTVVKSQPGAMIHMSGTVQLAGKTKFSFGKLLRGGEMHESVYTGPGKVTLGPTLSGDVITLPIVDGHGNGHGNGNGNGNGNARACCWRVGKDAFLACTADVGKESKVQGLSKALFSGEDLFVYNVVGNGLMWLKSFGAVDRIDLQPGEQHVVDNGHLVAWNCDYKIEKAGGGLLTSMKTGEGLICRFTGPGSVYIQTRNQEAFEEYIRAVAPSSGG